MPFKASIIIPTKNAGLPLKSVLDAVLRQEIDGAFEVLVVDSGSSDGTVELVRQYPQIRLIEIESREFGHGKTRNFAISNTTGEFIAMITHDALPLHSRWLAELLKTAEADARIAGVFGRHVAYPEATIFTQQELVAHFQVFLARPVVELDDPVRYANEEGYRQYLYFFSDNNALLRRTVWQEIPYPEVDFAEDQAWARLIIEAGYRKAYAPDAVVAHSHDYGFVERFQRSFDESYALRRLFDYQHGTGLRHALRAFVGLTLRDVRFAYRTKLYKSHWRQVAAMPVSNFMRVMGYFLGSQGSRIPRPIQRWLSRDQRLLAISSLKHAE
ncbi:rhamnosyltransferase [Rhodoferax sp. OV413]|uniref:glycosyltransferase family 2 protein n=1 Tax=Rhodoferax sp. OV413 TaxID=1855285 RepID=UPI000886A550|nr:glycosyltransferase family 2 protein [Rhodoferax sp. OV413]SDP44904.1 rhamnosyltransferase [Rhodoferax sp. OV413]